MAWSPERLPLRRPIGVLTASTMTTSRTWDLLRVAGKCMILYDQELYKSENGALVTDDELVERTDALLKEVDAHSVDQFTFRGAQFDAGLALVHFPEGKGGLGLNRSKQTLVDNVLRKAGVNYLDL